MTIDQAGEKIFAFGVDDAVGGVGARGAWGDGNNAVALDGEGAGAIGRGAGAIDDEGVGDEKPTGALTGVGRG